MFKITLSRSIQFLLWRIKLSIAGIPFWTVAVVFHGTTLTHLRSLCLKMGYLKSPNTAIFFANSPVDFGKAKQFNTCALLVHKASTTVGHSKQTKKHDYIITHRGIARWLRLRYSIDYTIRYVLSTFHDRWIVSSSFPVIEIVLTGQQKDFPIFMDNYNPSIPYLRLLNNHGIWKQTPNLNMLSNLAESVNLRIMPQSWFEL